MLSILTLSMIRYETIFDFYSEEPPIIKVCLNKDHGENYSYEQILRIRKWKNNEESYSWCIYAQQREFGKDFDENTDILKNLIIRNVKWDMKKDIEKIKKCSPHKENINVENVIDEIEKYLDLVNNSNFDKIHSMVFEVNDPIDALPKSKVIDILDILEGKKDANYSFKMNIPPKMIDQELVVLTDILINYKNNKHMTNKEWNILSSFAMTEFELDNIVGTIKYQFAKMLIDSYVWIDNDGLYFLNGSILFMDTKQINEDVVFDKMIKYLNWLTGKEFIIINTSFKSIWFSN